MSLPSLVSQYSCTSCQELNHASSGTSVTRLPCLSIAAASTKRFKRTWSACRLTLSPCTKPASSSSMARALVRHKIASRILVCGLLTTLECNSGLPKSGTVSFSPPKMALAVRAISSPKRNDVVSRDSGKGNCCMALIAPRQA